MALIKCPECGKEISDTSNKCVHCGFLIKKEKCKKKLVNMKTSLFAFMNKNKKYIIASICLVILLIIIICVVINSGKCNMCNERAIADSEYCIAHQCPVKGCKLCKSESDKYCDLHDCNWEDVDFDEECTNIREEGSKYCYFHKCSEENCVESRYIFGGSFCESHLIDVVRPLWNRGMNLGEISEETGIDLFALGQIRDKL